MISHETALTVHDLSNVMRAAVHLTAPPGSGKRALTGYILRRAALSLAAAGAALLCLLILAACAAPLAANTPRATSPDPMRMLVQPFSLEDAVAFIGAPFPASATGVETMGKAGLDTMVVARFEASLPDVLTYLDGLGLTAPLTPGFSPFFSSDPLYKETAAWWSPPASGSASGDFSGLHQRLDARYYSVAVVKSGGGLATVYLQVYNM